MQGFLQPGAGEGGKVIKLLITECPGWKTVFLFPNLIVPPICPWLCSGMSIMTGIGVKLSNSNESASFIPSTFLANSITAICKPKHIPEKKIDSAFSSDIFFKRNIQNFLSPKNGFLFSLHHLHAKIFPSTPLLPNPPGTKTPSLLHNFSQAWWYSTGSPAFVISSRRVASTNCTIKLGLKQTIQVTRYI